MELNLVPTLEVQRDLCRIERGGDRFRAYLTAMVGAGGELKLPLPLFNPMAREHVAALLDRLIAAGAEATAREALGAAELRLAAVDDALRVALVVADDAVGGWTDRYLSDEQVRFQGHGIFRRGWAVVALWSGDPPQAASGDHLAAATAAAAWRCAYQRGHGEPKSLRHRLLQEGLAAAFASGVVHTLQEATLREQPSPEYALHRHPLQQQAHAEPEHGAQKHPERVFLEYPLHRYALDREELAYTAEVVRPQLDATHFPTCFTCLYGDEAARSAGYTPLGLSPWAGFAYAAHVAYAAVAAGCDPIRALETGPATELGWQPGWQTH